MASSSGVSLTYSSSGSASTTAYVGTSPPSSAPAKVSQVMDDRKPILASSSISSSSSSSSEITGKLTENYPTTPYKYSFTREQIISMSGGHDGSPLGSTIHDQLNEFERVTKISVKEIALFKDSPTAIASQVPYDITTSLEAEMATMTHQDYSEGTVWELRLWFLNDEKCRCRYIIYGTYNGAEMQKEGPTPPKVSSGSFSTSSASHHLDQVTYFKLMNQYLAARAATIAAAEEESRAKQKRLAEEEILKKEHESQKQKLAQVATLLVRR